VEGMKDTGKIHSGLYVVTHQTMKSWRSFCRQGYSSGCTGRTWYRSRQIKTIYVFHRVGEDDDTDWGNYKEAVMRVSREEK